MSRRQNKGQNKPPTKPSALAQQQQDQADPQEGQTTLQKGQATLQEGQTTLQVRTEEFSGPLPPPDALEKYERVSPGAAERIIAMAETQSSHRHELESKGQNYAAMLGALAIISGTIAGVLGAQLVGSVIGGLVLVGLVSAFIQGRRGN